MDKIFNWEQWRIIAVSTVSLLFGYLTPTKGFVSCGSSNCLAIYSSLTVTITPAAAPAA